MSVHIKGRSVEVRTAEGEWIRAVALTGVRRDVLNAVNRRDALPSVLVEVEGWEHPINWPAEAVRPRPDSQEKTR